MIFCWNEGPGTRHLAAKMSIVWPWLKKFFFFQWKQCEQDLSWKGCFKAFCFPNPQTTQVSYGCTYCQLIMIPVSRDASCMYCQLHVLPVAHVAICTCCQLHMLPIANLSNLNKKIYATKIIQEISQIQNCRKRTI